MTIEILSPNKGVYKGEIKTVTLPGKEGQMQILDNHAPLFTLLAKGEIIIEKDKKISIFSGVVEVLDNKVTILVKEL
ncbi:MAG: ATP synthase F1 subunit epsilon [Candidatus Paceibacterales bacterium]